MSILLKKVTSTVSVLAIAASAIGATASVSAASEFLTYAENLSEAGIINAGTEAQYRLGDNITRAEVAKIAVMVSGVEMYECVGDMFADVGLSYDRSLCSAIETAAVEGFVNADATNFRPGALVTRAEMVKMLLAAKGVEPSDYETSFMDTNSLGDLAGYINAGVEVGALRDGQYFRPNATATRGEAFKVASTVLALEIDEGTDNGTDNGNGTSTGTTSTGTTSTGVVTSGDLSISSDASLIQVVPEKATVMAGKLTFAAKSSDVTVKSIIMKRGGLGNRTDIKSVWLEYNGMRVTTQASVNSDETATLSFTPSWTLKAGTTASLDVVVKLDGTSGSNHNFAIVAAKDISSTASTLAASFPIVSNTLNTMNYEVASLTYKKAGSSTLDVKGGDMNVVLGEFQLTRAGTANNREIMVSKIKLDNEKDFDVEKNVSNLAVYDKSTGTKVSKAVTFAGGKIYVDLEDKIPGTQSSRIYQIKGDITNTDRASEQLQFVFDSDEDSVIASEVTSAYRVNTAVAAGTSQDQMTLVTIKAGAVSLSTVGTTSNVDVSVGTNGVVLLNGKVNSREAVELKDLEIALDTSNGTSTGQYEKALSTITVTVGSQTVTFDAADFDDTGVYKIRNTFNITAGDSVVTIKADVRSDALSANSVATLGLKVKSLSSTSFTGGAKYVATNKSVPSAEFYGSISPSTTTVKQSTVALSNTSNGAVTVVKGARDVSLAKYEYTNSKVDTVRVSGEKFNVSLNTSSGAQYVPLQNMTLDLYVNGDLRGSDVVDVVGASGSVDFSSVTFEIAKSSKATIEVKAREISRDLANNLVLTVTRTSEDNITTGANSDTISANTPGSGTPVSLGEAMLTIAVASADGSDVLSSNSMKQELAVITVTAKNDDVRLTDITVPFAELADRELIQNAVLLDATKTPILSTTSVTNSGIVFADLSYTIKAGTRADLYVAVDTKAISTSTSTGQTTVQLAVGSGSLLVKAEGTIDAVTASNMTLPTAGTLTAKDLISGGKLVIATKEVKNASKGQFVYSITNNGNTSVNLSSMKFGGTVAGTVKIYKNATENDDNRLDAMTIAASGSSYTAANFVRNLEVASGQTVEILVDVDLNSAISATEQTKFTLTVSDLAYAEDVNGAYILPVASTSAFRNTGLPKDSPAIDVNATSTLQ